MKNINLQFKIFFLAILFSSFLGVAQVSNAAVIFEDNFDSQADWTRLQPTNDAENCFPGASGSGRYEQNCASWNLPAGWDGLRNGFSRCTSNAPGYNNLYLDQIPGYPAESSGTCRGGSGKCVTFWEEACQLSQGAYDDSDKNFSVDLGAEYQELYIRYFMRYKPGWQWGTNGLTGGTPIWKIMHIQHYEYGGVTPYSYFTNYNCANSPVTVPMISSWLGDTSASVENSDPVYLNYSSRCFAGNNADCNSDNYYCVDHRDWSDNSTDSILRATIGNIGSNTLITDSNWHSVEFHVKINTYNGSWNADGITQIWIDGVLVKNSTNLEVFFGNAPTNPPRGYNYISFGGNNNNDFTKSEDTADGEQWYAIDDVVISTSYVGPDYIIGADTTPPSAPQGLAVQ